MSRSPSSNSSAVFAWRLPTLARGACITLAEGIEAAPLYAQAKIARELEVVAEKLTRRRDGLREFGNVFGDAARARRGDGFASASYHLEMAIARVDEVLAERIEDAEAPFWAHVRDALAERHP